MNKTTNTLATIILSSVALSASAEYMVNIPLEESNGGALPDDSIVFVSASSTPVEPVEQIPEGLEGYQNINGMMNCSVNGTSSSCVADEMSTKIYSQYNDVINVSVNAGYSNCGLGCDPVYSVGLSVTINGSVQEIVDKASTLSFTDVNNSTITCPVSDKKIFATMDNTTYQDEYNTKVTCYLDGYNAPSSSGTINYSVSIK